MTTDERDPDMTAAELALGLLEGEERAAALRRVLSDPAFAREVEDWRHRIAGLFDDYGDAAAPESVATRLQAPAAPSASTAAGVNRWRFIAVATAVAAAIALFFVSRPPPPVIVPHGIMVAALTMADAPGTVPAVVDMTMGEVRVAGAAMAPRGKSAELWMIGGDGVPKAVGLLADTGPSRLKLTADQVVKLSAGMTLAVSVEPVGGSPTGKPTGPVVASGKLALA